MSKRNRQTDQIEMVETYNLCLSLNRLHGRGIFDSLSWKRALYHALCMSSCGSFEEKALIRQALRLP